MSSVSASSREHQAFPTSIPSPVQVAGLRNQEPDGEALGLVRQVFFPPSGEHRRKIFFAWTGSEPGKAEFCERIAKAVASLCSGSVALVGNMRERNHEFIHEVWPASTPVSISGEKCVWHVSPETIQSEFTTTAKVLGESPFDYVIFGGSVQESWTPTLAGSCDGVVLVVTANRTRRQAALRAREMLAGWNLSLLGTVLNHRTFPVPESIYRRL